MTVVLLVGLAMLGLVMTTVLGAGLPAPLATLSSRREGRARASAVTCDFCRSSHVVVNSRKKAYRCAHCGFGATLTGAEASELANMESHSHEGSGRET